MSDKLFPAAFPARAMTPFWRQMALILIGLCVLYGGLSVLEQVSITYMDWWIPLTSMEEAEWYSIAISQGAELVRIILVGIAVYLIAKVAVPASQLSAPRFLGFWSLVALLLALVLLGLDTVGYNLQFGGVAMDGETFRTYFLLLMYAKVVIYYLSLRLLLGAGAFAGSRRAGFGSAWTATSTIQSLVSFAVFVAIKLSIDGIMIPVVSYLPFVSPFWFIPDEMAPHRYLLGQGTRIVSEAIALALYALAWLAFVGRTATSTHADIPGGVGQQVTQRHNP